MRSRFNILFTLALCALYLLSYVGMTVHFCACSNSKQLSSFVAQTEHKCAEEQSCCAKKHTCQHEEQDKQHKKPCCSSESISLKTEHHPEQSKLKLLPTDFFSAIALVAIVDSALPIASNEVVGSLCKHDTPPKIPLIYQHSCLRL